MLGVGLSWSASIPYYSQRRALMIPAGDEGTFIANPTASAELLGSYRVGALVGGGYRAITRELLRNEESAAQQGDESKNACEV